MTASLRYTMIAAFACLVTAVGQFSMPSAIARVAITDRSILPNASFVEGSDTPTGWAVTGGNARWIDRDILEVTGDGQDSNYWRADCRFASGALYRFRIRGRGTPSEGCAVAGPVFANRDYRTPSPDWIELGHVFRVPDNVTDSYIRLGQWHANGSIQFDHVALTPVFPIHRGTRRLYLGEGESVTDGRYSFAGTFGHQGSNYHRTLHETTTAFNSDRWTFSSGSHVTYRFGYACYAMLSGTLNFNVNYHVAGICSVEVSRDEENWTKVATQEGVGSQEVNLPESLFPHDRDRNHELFVRFTAGKGAGFQINQIDFAADLSGTPPDATGATVFADIQHGEGDLSAIKRLFLHEHPRTGTLQLSGLLVNPTSNRTIAAAIKVTPNSAAGDETKPQLANHTLRPKGWSYFHVNLPSQEAGKHDVELDISMRGILALRALLQVTVPDFYRTDYGERLSSDNAPVGLWWCNAAHKISRKRALPTATASAVRLSAARNDFEAVQVVVRPDKRLEGLTARASALSGPNSSTIPAEDIEILRVAYHFVNHPTDSTGTRDWWPDALPPLNKPIDVTAGRNQPLWVLVHVSEDIAPGDYSGTISLAAKEYSAEVPVELHVWNFTLPRRNHIETAFGFSPGTVFRYHNLKTDEDRRCVLDMYFQSFSEHRISPYDPAPLDRIGVEFLPETDPPRAEVDFAAFDRAMARAVDKYHFTGIRLPINGMGGGTFHSRSEPSILGYGEDTPEYQAMFASYARQLEKHLRDKGWLDKAYVYWFDEPAPKDYEFVANGMRRLRKHAPGLRRMLTEEPGDNELAGLVDIWCPVSHNYHHEKAETRRAHGETFWWYVCTGPKAPYCTLFIDHPAVELRTWAWQAWKRDIRGLLIWQSNYWTSSAAFPDTAQNPYDDPMGYVSGYSTPAGTKRFWGNGDGRFLYPPESAAVPGLGDGKPVIAPPVSSIRWEMLREGIEDYECLYLLRRLLAAKGDSLSNALREKCALLLEVPEAITRDMTTFSTDPGPIYARRAKVAEAIERLQ